MAKKNVGAVMVIEDGRLVGVFTERDIAFRVVALGLDAQTTRLADVMTPAPDTVDPDKPFGYALLTMYERGFRHLPVIQDGNVVGIVSARSAIVVRNNSRRGHSGVRRLQTRADSGMISACCSWREQSSESSRTS